jgi:hypothetical protein
MRSRMHSPNIKITEAIFGSDVRGTRDRPAFSKMGFESNSTQKKQTAFERKQRLGCCKRALPNKAKSESTAVCATVAHSTDQQQSSSWSYCPMLTPCSSALPERPPLKNPPEYYVTRRFINVFTRTLHLSLS